jgi:DNA polymerase-3 subunit beta
MKLEIEINKIRDAVTKVLPVIDKRNSRPILTQALIKAKNNSLEISATDLEVSIKVILDCNVTEEGTFCVKLKSLSDILRELPEGNVSFEIKKDENILHLKQKEISFDLVIFNFDDFPQLTFNNSKNIFSIQSTRLQKILNKTSYAISTDENRLFLNGLFIQNIDNILRAVATDGHRLSLIDTEMEKLDDTVLDNGVIIPRKGISELKKLTDYSDDTEIKLSIDDSFFYASVNENHFLSVRLIAREYPKYQAVIPAKTVNKFIVNKKQFSDAVRRIKIMSNEKSNGVRIDLNDNEMIINSNHPTLGEAKEKIPVVYTGKELSMGFNARYLIETLSVIDEEDIVVEFNNEISPIIVKPDSTSDFFGIIMPLKL